MGKRNEQDGGLGRGQEENDEDFLSRLQRHS
jgi:hypothetical protein